MKYIASWSGGKASSPGARKRNGGLSVENRKFHIWSEGYSITGNNSGAIYLGEFEADTFEHACDKWAKTLTDDYSRKCYSPAKDGKPPSFWGCRLYDNEMDARKAFG